MTGVLPTGGGLDTDLSAGRMPTEPKDSQLQAREVPGTEPPLMALKRTSSADTLISDLWTPEPGGNTSRSLSHPVYGALLWQP